MCPIRATCLSADCCSSELALLNQTKRVDLVQSGPRHHLILTCPRYDVAEKLLRWC